jgi:hypothetical protein
LAAWVWSGQGAPDTLILCGFGIGLVGLAVVLGMMHLHRRSRRQVSSAGQ